jgi:hypothetical protein
MTYAVSLAGIALVLLALVGRRFTIGLTSPRPVSALYGRIWLAGAGLILLAYSVPNAFGKTINPRFGCGFTGVFVAYNGFLVAIVGILLSISAARQVEWKNFGIALAMGLGGTLLGVYGLFASCP